MVVPTALWDNSAIPPEGLGRRSEALSWKCENPGGE